MALWVNCAFFTQTVFEVLEKSAPMPENIQQNCQIPMVTTGPLPCFRGNLLHRVFASWQGVRPTRVFLCLHFPSDLNCQSSSIFTVFVKTPLFSLLPVVVSFLLLKIVSQSSPRLREEDLTDCAFQFVAESQSHLWCSADWKSSHANQLCPHNRVCHQLFSARATKYWVVVSTAGQSLLHLQSSWKITSLLRI